MTEDDLAILRASESKRIALTCVDGETIVGEVAWVATEDVIVNAVQQRDGTWHHVSTLSVKFADISAVRVMNE